ncbi:uncharacterized protein LOC111700118 [Eurytemora carolleeae]|uniref:uncharacterized protein LOC111700118 n=1 Tax=Eurytemora carolleeae TaxID=1294199 RepID=UPI000C764075|nr:uncharacterized protein LOC111700118 [Eurytemora carolleeae]|eukprot:XP_023326707.1 uncharacterized protein LOC111700118 [Eurytemora affinis]
MKFISFVLVFVVFVIQTTVLDGAAVESALNEDNGSELGYIFLEKGLESLTRNVRNSNQDEEVKRAEKKSGRDKKTLNNNKKKNGEKSKKEEKDKKNKKGKKSKKEKRVKSMNRTLKEKKINEKDRKIESRAVTEKCVTDLAELSGIFGNQARNFYQIAGRALSANSIIESKNGKKTNFKDSYAILLSSVGGNPKNVTCAGTTVKNDSVSETATILEACETKIAEACGTTLSAEDLKLITDCRTAADDFRKLYSSLMVLNNAKTATELCTAATDSKLQSLKDQVRNCAFLTTNGGAAQAQPGQRNACNKAFANCRTAERNTLSAVDKCFVCPRPTTPTAPGVTTTKSIRIRSRRFPQIKDFPLFKS